MNIWRPSTKLYPIGVLDDFNDAWLSWFETFAVLEYRPQWLPLPPYLVRTPLVLEVSIQHPNEYTELTPLLTLIQLIESYGVLLQTVEVTFFELPLKKFDLFIAHIHAGSLMFKIEKRKDGVSNRFHWRIGLITGG